MVLLFDVRPWFEKWRLRSTSRLLVLRAGEAMIRAIRAKAATLTAKLYEQRSPDVKSFVGRRRRGFIRWIEAYILLF